MRRSPPDVATVAVRVGDALRRAGVGAVLTGGACASLYARGAYQSADVDFVLQGVVSQETLDAALRPLGFTRRGGRYVRRGSPIYVEFPRGPLAIGADHRIRPVRRGRGRAQTLALSATDACRDRLAAFYHWDDRQALAAAVAIAARNRVAMTAIRTWSEREGASEGFEEFRAALRHARAGPARRG